jgi:hypothetical protein
MKNIPQATQEARNVYHRRYNGNSWADQMYWPIINEPSYGNPKVMLFETELQRKTTAVMVSLWLKIIVDGGRLAWEDSGKVDIHGVK